MRAFQVELNDKLLCTAGVGDNGVCDTIVNFVGDPKGSELRLRVGGLFTATREHAVWRRRNLKVGDKVVVTIVETDVVDRPRERYTERSATAEKNQKAYVLAWAKHFGWQVRTSAAEARQAKKRSLKRRTK